MTRIAVPSKGRLRESVLELLSHAGYKVSAKRTNASAVLDGVEFIEMRPGDAAPWLAAGRLDAAFISTDTALENGIEDWDHVELGFARSDLVIACRDDAPYRTAADLAGLTVATHLPNWTRRWFASMDVEVDIVAMGGSLEGICARGLADAIVDLRETGNSLAEQRAARHRRGPGLPGDLHHGTRRRTRRGRDASASRRGPRRRAGPST